MSAIHEALIASAAELTEALRPHAVPAGRAEIVLDPLQYAWQAHAQYLERYAPRREGVAVWLGMNPGPWGMAQTGVPFGSVPMVRDFLGIEVPITAPANTHPKRPILGFACTRREVSGDRLWGTVQQHCGTPEWFFERHFVSNYCPLLWQSETGANLTPDKLPRVAMEPVLERCDAHLAAVLRASRPAMVIGVGTWAEKCARRVVEGAGLDIPVGRILHPSPASPAANRGWAAAVVPQLEALGHPLAPPPAR